MSEDYTIDQLEKTFKKHSENNIIQRKKSLEKFKNDYPDSEIPPHMLNDFFICEALHVICKEINQLKKEIKYGKTYQRFKSGNA